jgi:MFS family permease
MLANVIDSIWYILALAFVYALYRRGYWISRRYYNLNVMEKEKIGTTFSIISIVNNLGVILASYVGALMLDYLNVMTVTIISIIVFLLSIVPLTLMKFKHEKDDIKIEVRKTFKEIPFRDLYLFGSYELLNVVKFMFALYIFIYVKDTYATVGFFNLITNISVLVFSYLYGKKIDRSNNLLKLSIVLVVVTYILKANTTYIALAIVSFLEGIFTKMHEISISKEFYALSKKFEYNNYNLVYEIVQNSFRSLTLFVIYILNADLKVAIYCLLLIMFLGAFMNFKYIDKKDYKPAGK